MHTCGHMHTYMDVQYIQMCTNGCMYVSVGTHKDAHTLMHIHTWTFSHAHQDVHTDGCIHAHTAPADRAEVSVLAAAETTRSAGDTTCHSQGYLESLGQTQAMDSIAGSRR